MTIKNKLFSFSVKEAESDKRVLRFVGSDETEDRAGDIMTLDGWNLDQYMKNPVFLFGHDYSSPPVGKALGVTIGEKGLEFDIEFADKETYPFADTIYRLFKGGFMKAVSVGFIPKKMNYDPKSGVNYILEKELLELSAVSVPANPNAVLTNALEKGIISKSEMEEVLKIGRTISRKNLELLMKAREAMSSAVEVIDEVMKQKPEDEEEEEKGLNDIYEKILGVKEIVGGCSCCEHDHKGISKNILNIKKILSQGGSK